MFLLRREQHFLFCGRPDSQKCECLLDLFWPTKQMEKHLVWKFCQCFHAKLYSTTRTWMVAYVFINWNTGTWELNWQKLTILRNMGLCEVRQQLRGQGDNCQQYQEVKLMLPYSPIPIWFISRTSCQTKHFCWMMQATDLSLVCKTNDPPFSWRSIPLCLNRNRKIHIYNTGMSKFS